jgi:carbon monoxide dehydrogenase subunit G
MNYAGTVDINAARQTVWDFLLDVDRFSACMPGVEDLNRLDDRNFTGTMKAKVGPFTGAFEFQAEIVESEPPAHLSAHVAGQDTVTKSTMTSDIAMTLATLGPQQTQLSYQAVVDVKGRLAIIGDLVIRATGAQVINEFFRRLCEQIEATGR